MTMKKKWTGYFNFINDGSCFQLVEHQSRDLPIWSFPSDLQSGVTRIKFEFFDYSKEDPTEKDSPSGKVVYQNDKMVFSLNVSFVEGDYKFNLDIIETSGDFTLKPVGEATILPDKNTDIFIQKKTL